jgi:ABC-2 type transport system permease protein
MSNVFLVARQEIRFALRERLAVALLVIFLGMAVVSSAIGWASHHTVTRVYDLTVAQTGRAIPNPFADTSPLEVVKNTIIYVVLIGALLAIVVGARSFIRDRRSGVTELILSRPTSLRSYVIGKLIGVQAWLGLVLAAAAAATWIAVWLVESAPLSGGQSLRLLGFFVLAWVFLLPFVAIGLIAGARSGSESTALLAPVLVWVAFVFVLPQLGTAQNPTSLLNPVPSAAPTGDLFFKINHAVLQPISFTEHFKHVAGVLLQLRDIDPAGAGRDLAFLLVMVAVSVAALALITRTAVRRPLYA